MECDRRNLNPAEFPAEIGSDVLTVVPLSVMLELVIPVELLATGIALTINDAAVTLPPPLRVEQLPLAGE